jgi:hypothetical protein
MANTPVFTMRLSTGIKGALSVISRDERRSVANLINKVMENYIEQHGMMLCPDCNGHGLGPMVEEDEPNLCDTCDGHGYVKRGKR